MKDSKRTRDHTKYMTDGWEEYCADEWLSIAKCNKNHSTKDMNKGVLREMQINKQKKIKW